MSNHSKLGRLKLPLFFSAPWLATAITVSAVVLGDVFRVPAHFAPLLMAVIVLNGCFAVVGSVVGTLSLEMTRRRQLVVAIVAAVFSLIVYAFASAFFSYIILFGLGQTRWARL